MSVMDVEDRRVPLCPHHLMSLGVHLMSLPLVPLSHSHVPLFPCTTQVPTLGLLRDLNHLGSYVPDGTGLASDPDHQTHPP